MKNSRELVQQTIRHKPTTTAIKGELVLDDEVIQKSLQSQSIGFDERVEFVKKMGLDMIVLSPEYIEKKGSVSINCGSLDIDQWANTELFSFVILDGAFELGLRVFGLPEFLSMIMSEDTELEAFIAHVEKNNVETAKMLADHGINGIILADDIAYQDGLFIRPSQFKDLFLPTLERQVKVIGDRQMVPFYHSDGNYFSIMDNIVEAGFQGIHCIDQGCHMHLKDLKDYSDEICLWGHLDVHYIEEAKDKANMKAIVEEIKDATDFKGFILGTNSGLFTGMDVGGLKDIYENVDQYVLSSKI